MTVQTRNTQHNEVIKKSKATRKRVSARTHLANETSIQPSFRQKLLTRFEDYGLDTARLTTWRNVFFAFAFVYLAAANFDPFWMTEPTEVRQLTLSPKEDLIDPKIEEVLDLAPGFTHSAPAKSTAPARHPATAPVEIEAERSS